MYLFFMGSLRNLRYNQLLGLVILHVCTNIIIDSSPLVSPCHVAVKIKVLCISSPVRQNSPCNKELPAGCDYRAYVATAEFEVIVCANS